MEKMVPSFSRFQVLPSEVETRSMATEVAEWATAIGPAIYTHFRISRILSRTDINHYVISCRLLKSIVCCIHRA